jgi:hypothetical protein
MFCPPSPLSSSQLKEGATGSILQTLAQGNKLYMYIDTRIKEREKKGR